MNKTKFEFDNNQFNELFPFYFLINEKLEFISTGKSLQLVEKITKKTKFSDVFDFVRPETNKVDYDFLSKLGNNITLIKLRQKDVLFRGEFKVYNNNSILFLGSPWFQSMDEVVSHNLSLSNFAIHDPLIDLLYLVKTYQLASEDAQQLLDNLNQQKVDLVNSKLEIETTNNRLTTLITNLQSGILMEDENRRIVLVNEQFCKMFNIPAHPLHLVGVDCSQSAEQSKGMFRDEQKFVDDITKILFDKKLIQNELLELKDGRIFQRSYIPIFIEKEYKGHLWNYEDVTQKYKAEEVIKIREENYRNIIANMNLGLLEVDPKERILFANKSFLDMSGYKLNELLGNKATDLFTFLEDLPKLEETNNKRINDLVSDVNEVRIKDKNNNERWWLVSGAPSLNDKGNVIGSIGIHLDITRQKQLENQLIEARIRAESLASAKNNFLTNMSHEIRTPMNVILGMIKQVSKTNLSQHQNFYIDSINTAAEHLLVVINDILDISKIEEGKLEIEQIGFNPAELIQKISSVLISKAEQKGIEIKYTIDKNLSPILLGDPYRINQILFNLIGNSIKFTESGTIEISCKVEKNLEENQSLCFSVKDTGIGMNKEFLNNVFDKFTQAETSNTRKYGGTGLGLTITKSLVNLMNGEIFIDSQINNGTIVSINITLPKGSEKDIPISNKVIAEVNVLKDKNILLVDDNELNRLLAKEVIQSYGAVITEAVNGEDAIDKFKASQFDIILMDISMPKMNGYEATEKIRNEFQSKIPIVALTANAIKGENKKCFQVGMNDYISKPFEETDLIRVIAKWLGENVNIVPRVETLNDKLIYDLSKVNEIAKGNKLIIAKVINLFIEQMNECIAGMQKAIDEKNAEQLYFFSHKAKTSILNFSVNSVKNEILEIEQLANKKNLSDNTIAMVEYVINNLEKVIELLIEKELKE